MHASGFTYSALINGAPAKIFSGLARAHIQIIYDSDEVEELMHVVNRCL